MKERVNAAKSAPNYRTLWAGLAGVIVVSFLILGYYGTEIFRQMPPVPARVVVEGEPGNPKQ